MEGGRRRVTLWDQMSAVDNRRDSLAGLTLDDVLGTGKRSDQVNRTLLDIIRDEEGHGAFFGPKDKKSWKAFRDRLRLKRTGSAWNSSIPIPASDISVHTTNNAHNSRSLLMCRRNSVRFTTLSTATSQQSTDQSDVGEGPPSRIFRPQMSRHNSVRFPAALTQELEGDEVDDVPARDGTRRLAAALAEERSLSAREAVAAQEASEAAAQTAAEEDEEAESPNESGTEAQPVRMSLMDLLEETDREMGLEGSRYTIGGDDGEEFDDEEDDREVGEGGTVEHTCCVCMVRHKGSAFIPCGHTFCRLCSRELWVQRGNCPLCNGFILEILDIF